MTAAEIVATLVTAVAGGSLLVWRKQIAAWLSSPRGQRVLRAAFVTDEEKAGTALRTGDHPEVHLEPEVVDAKETIEFLMGQSNAVVMTQGELLGRQQERYEEQLTAIDARFRKLEADYAALSANHQVLWQKQLVTERDLAIAQAELDMLRRRDGEKDKLIGIQQQRIADLEAERDNLRKQLAGLEARIGTGRTVNKETN